MIKNISSGVLANSICGLFGNNSGNDSAKRSSTKLQSLFNTAAERIETMRQTYGDDFDKKMSLQDSLLIHYIAIDFQYCHLRHSKARQFSIVYIVKLDKRNTKQSKIH